MDHSTPLAAQSNFCIEGARSGPLGIVTKTTSPPTPVCVSPSEVVDTETGEVFSLSDFKFRLVDGCVTPSVSDCFQHARASRWGLKSVVNKLLPDIRTSKCMVLRAPVLGGLADIDLCRGSNTNKAYYHGLMTCGSIWTCPICAAKISERRRQELKDAIQVSQQKDLRAHFVTLTFPHGISDDLNDILSKMSQAFKRLSAGKYRVKKLLSDLNPDFSIEGFIRAIEVTHGKNGFHPHIHMIVFTNSVTKSSDLLTVYGTAWERACVLAGLPAPSREHGCTVQDGSRVAEYVSKWGIEDEMTKSNAKIGKTKGLSPWGLLRCVLDGDDVDYPPKKAGDLFRVYAKAFAGRRQLYWSNGLRARLELSKEVTDQEIADRQEDDRASILATLSTQQWKAIRSQKMESVLLDVAEKQPHLVTSFIASIVGDLQAPSPIPVIDRWLNSAPLEVSLDDHVKHTKELFTTVVNGLSSKRSSQNLFRSKQRASLIKEKFLSDFAPDEYFETIDYFNSLVAARRGAAKPERVTSRAARRDYRDIRG